MRKKLESKQIIVINAAVVLLFILILVIVNLFYFDRLNTSLSSINENHNHKLDIITQMSRIVRDRSLTMLNMHLSNDPWYIDEQYMRFHRLAPEFIVLRKRLRELPLAADEQAELDRCLALIGETQPLQENIVQRIYEGGDDRVLHDIMHEDMPMENELWQGFDRLNRLVRDNAEQARQAANRDFENSLRIIIVVAAVLALLTTLLMIHALRRLQRIETRLIDRAELLSWDATHDPLTNIWNRRFLEHRVNQLISGDHPPEPQHVLVYIDLDNFKPINDTYGHFLGDDFLRAIAQCIEPCIRKNDTLARIGGDEFAILLENCTPQKAGAIAECVRSSINNCTITYNSQTIRNEGCSIGIAGFDEQLEDFQHLLKQADHACYSAKRAGKNRIIHASAH
ncbi:diguanylate cyclase domain-containing protein [Thiohalophilus sp.]|uniref:diguanylate cyclase domain-containing protein n=1 Tax=Thiohalophilus sp. TaxID=3028392 RepID=UPI002ACEDD66|nr:diguanylate cyclase [Thiohalophilus sp.]MDZ7660970.1 diguanylate cyclase [Thiohalophilus sp.]